MEVDEPHHRCLPPQLHILSQVLNFSHQAHVLLLAAIPFALHKLQLLAEVKAGTLQSGAVLHKLGLSGL